MASLASTAIAPVGEASPAQASGEFNVAAHGLRGVASMMVFFAHLMGGTARHIYSTDNHYVATVTPFWNIGTFGVELFFMISGFVILPSVRKYTISEFALRRFLRLYPLFFTFSVLFVILNRITGAYPDFANPLTEVSAFLFLNLFTGTEQLTPNAWSLSFEVMFYTGTATVYYFAFVRRSLLLTLVATVASLAFWISFPITTYFVLGLAVRLLDDRRTDARWWPARWLEGLALAAMLALASIAHHEYSWDDIFAPEVPPLMLASAAYFYFAVRRDSLTAKLLGNRATLYLGTVSYSLYIVHPYVYLPMRIMFQKMGWFEGDSLRSLAVFALAVTPPMLVATAIIHNVLERWPYAAFFRQSIYGNRGNRGNRGVSGAA